jgi:hypothetical protein
MRERNDLFESKKAESAFYAVNRSENPVDQIIRNAGAIPLERKQIRFDRYEVVSGFHYQVIEHFLIHVFHAGLLPLDRRFRDVLAAFSACEGAGRQTSIAARTTHKADSNGTIGWGEVQRVMSRRR